jgi:putative phosphoesterase
MPDARHAELSAAARITAPAGDGLRLAVVADTHSRPHEHTAALLRAAAPHAILHAGDIGELTVLDELRAIAPLHAIRGNIDVRAADLPDVITLDLDVPGAAVPALRILLVHIGVNGVKLRADVARRARAEKAQLVVCGHSHIPFIGEDRGITIFNPGSVGPRRFSLPIVFGMIELGARGVRFAHIDAETGKRWSPP